MSEFDLDQLEPFGESYECITLTDSEILEKLGPDFERYNVLYEKQDSDAGLYAYAESEGQNDLLPLIELRIRRRHEEMLKFHTELWAEVFFLDMQKYLEEN